MRGMLCCLALALAAGALRASDESGFRVGTSRIAITPTEPLWLAGYASRNRPSDGVEHDIWVKAAAFGREDSKVDAVLITADLLGFDARMRQAIYAKARSRFSLEPRQLMLCASHSHAAPVVGAETMYPMDENQRRKSMAYSDRVVDWTIDAIGKAIGDMRPAKLELHEASCEFAFNRRNNPEAEVPARRKAGTLVGPVDHRVRILTASRVDGEPALCVFAYACHNTTLGGNFFKVCGDYAGFAQTAIEKSIPGCTAMFVAGCGGDQNPGPRGSLELAKQYGGELAAAVGRGIAAEGRRLKAADIATRLEDVELQFDKSPTREELEKASTSGPDYYQRWAKRWLKEVEAGRPLPATYGCPVQVWRIGEFSWVSLGGEVVVDFSLRLRRELGSNVWVTAYANDVMSYIPSHRVLKEGGYEGATSMYAWGQPAYRWADDVEERVIKGVHRLYDK